MNRQERRAAARQTRRATLTPAPPTAPAVPGSLLARKVELQVALDELRQAVSDTRTRAESFVVQANAFIAQKTPEIYRLEGAINLLDEQIAAEQQPPTDAPIDTPIDGVEHAEGDASE